MKTVFKSEIQKAMKGRKSPVSDLKQKMKLFFPACSLFFIMIFSPSLYAQQASGGGYAESYLQRDVGARPIAMGGAYTAIVNEPFGIFYNPACLSLLPETPSFNTSYSFLEFGRTHTAAAWGQNFFDNFGFGFGINNYTTGTFMSRDNRGNPLRKMTDWQIAMVGGASYRQEFASIGITAKYLSHNLQGAAYGADGFSMDLGAKFNVMDLFSFGMSVQNFTGMMFWNKGSKEDDILPFTLRSGIAFEFGLNEDEYTTRSTVSGELENVYVEATRYVLVSVEGILTQFEEGPSVVLGVEAVPHEVIAFRAGIGLMGDYLGAWKIFPMTIWGGGVSIRPEIEELPFELHIDYSVASDHLSTSGISHHLSLFFGL